MHIIAILQSVCIHSWRCTHFSTRAISVFATLSATNHDQEESPVSAIRKPVVLRSGHGAVALAAGWLERGGGCAAFEGERVGAALYRGNFFRAPASLQPLLHAERHAPR